MLLVVIKVTNVTKVIKVIKVTKSSIFQKCPLRTHWTLFLLTAIPCFFGSIGPKQGFLFCHLGFLRLFLLFFYLLSSCTLLVFLYSGSTSLSNPVKYILKKCDMAEVWHLYEKCPLSHDALHRLMVTNRTLGCKSPETTWRPMDFLLLYWFSFNIFIQIMHAVKGIQFMEIKQGKVIKSVRKR